VGELVGNVDEDGVAGAGVHVPGVMEADGLDEAGGSPWMLEIPGPRLAWPSPRYSASMGRGGAVFITGFEKDGGEVLGREIGEGELADVVEEPHGVEATSAFISWSGREPKGFW
jgi:hypothetical protein